jgi:hypothetical protein
MTVFVPLVQFPVSRYALDARSIQTLPLCRAHSILPKQTRNFAIARITDADACGGIESATVPYRTSETVR